jgi:hypothetical protein
MQAYVRRGFSDWVSLCVSAVVFLEAGKKRTPGSHRNTPALLSRAKSPSHLADPKQIQRRQVFCLKNFPRFRIEKLCDRVSSPQCRPQVLISSLRSGMQTHSLENSASPRSLLASLPRLSSPQSFLSSSPFSDLDIKLSMPPRSSMPARNGRRHLLIVDC